MKTGIEWCPEKSVDNAEAELKEIRALGYDCVDFQSFCHTENIFFDGTVRDMEKLLKRVKIAAENAGIEISQTHGPWRWPPQDATEEDRSERFEKMVRSLEGTAMVGCADMVIHPVMPFGDNQNPDPERFMEINLEFFNRLTLKAREYGVTIDFENMPMPALTLASPRQILDFAKQIDSPYFRVCLDTGHCTMLKVDPGQAVREIGKQYLRVLHVHDNNGVSDLHWLPETGVIDWKNFSAALHEIGFDGVFSLETNVKPNGLEPEELLRKRQELSRTARRLAGG
ncbi:MAG: sugar phosphate isomerase/epimerase [Clostridia bacterium]|nr:sugar phosphate isomerase/epimerase [Clostridia bacterium]